MITLLARFCTGLGRSDHRVVNNAKYWLEPVALEFSSGFSRGELMNIYRLISERQAVLVENWHDYFGD
jgi:hypothetical protein